ncbi:MAG: hypothetical protein ACN6PN_15800 [Sphingobacterium sp.]
MLIQPLVENAVHHGIRRLVDRPGVIKINLRQTEACIVIEVLDNGVDFVNKEPQDNKTSKPLRLA